MESSAAKKQPVNKGMCGTCVESGVSSAPKLLPEADNYSGGWGDYVLFINGDGRDVLRGEFDLHFLTGHLV